MSNVSLTKKLPATSLATEGSSIAYVDWGAIIAGAVVAAAISTIMTSFGAAIGLSAAPRR